MNLSNSDASFRCHSRNCFFAVILLFASVSTIFGQEFLDRDVIEEKPPLKERLFYGGNLGLQFGTITDIQLSPVVGLWVLPRLAIAVGPDYRYYKDPYDETNMYGGKGYLQFVVIKDISTLISGVSHTGIFLHVEDELLSLESSFFKGDSFSGRFYTNAVLTGAGISQPIGRRSSLNIMLLWALYNPDYGLYNNPEMRISFSF